jgi:hypothetical protein
MAQVDPTKLVAWLPRSKLRNEESLQTVRQVLGWMDPQKAARLTPAVHPPVPPAPGRNRYIFFFGYAQVGMNFPLSSFFKAILDYYGLVVGDLTPNSILMLATFAYLCEAYVGVPPSVTLWRHFFILRQPGTGQPFGGFSFQRRRNTRTKYLDCDFDGKWDEWRTHWMYVTLEEPETRMELPTGATRIDLDQLNEAPAMGEEWNPVLVRIAALGKNHLHTTHVLVDFVYRRFAPLRQNRTRYWEYTGPADFLRVSPGAPNPTVESVVGFLRTCISDRTDERIFGGGDIKRLFQDPPLRARVLPAMPEVDEIGLVRPGGDSCSSEIQYQGLQRRRQ